jgi:hypothetical protein
MHANVRIPEGPELADPENPDTQTGGGTKGDRDTPPQPKTER